MLGGHADQLRSISLSTATASTIRVSAIEHWQRHKSVTDPSLLLSDVDAAVEQQILHVPKR